MWTSVSPCLRPLLAVPRLLLAPRVLLNPPAVAVKRQQEVQRPQRLGARFLAVRLLEARAAAAGLRQAGQQREGEGVDVALGAVAQAEGESKVLKRFIIS